MPNARRLLSVAKVGKSDALTGRYRHRDNGPTALWGWQRGAATHPPAPPAAHRRFRFPRSALIFWRQVLDYYKMSELSCDNL